MINRKLWLYLKYFFERKGFHISELLLPTRYGSFSIKEDFCMEPFLILRKDLSKLKKKFCNKKKNIFTHFEKQLINEQAEVWIDGANISHFSQKQSNYSLTQVNEVYNRFSKWKKARIVLSETRVKKIKRLIINRKEQCILHKWRLNKDLSTCPTSIDDDQWWILGSLNCLEIYKQLTVVTNDLLRDFSFSGKEFITSSWLQTHIFHIFTNSIKYVEENKKIEMKEFLSTEKIYIYRVSKNINICEQRK